jgi:hypothetical protein
MAAGPTRIETDLCCLMHAIGRRYRAYKFTRSLRAGKHLSGIDWQPRSVLRLEVTGFHDNRSPPLMLVALPLIVPQQQTIAVTLPPVPTHCISVSRSRMLRGTGSVKSYSGNLLQ